MGKDILAIRERYGLSRQDIENRYHVPQRTLYNWESGLRECPLYVKELLIEAIDRDNNNLHDVSEILKVIEKFESEMGEKISDCKRALKMIQKTN